MSKKLLIPTGILFVALLAGGIYLVKHNSSTSGSTVVPQKQNAPVQTKQQADQANQPAQNVPISTSTDVKNLIADQKSGAVHANADVTNATDASATCVFTFENPNDKPVVRQVSVSAKGSVCDSGDIPEQEFTHLGQWKVTLRYYSNNTQAVATTNITIQ